MSLFPQRDAGLDSLCELPSTLEYELSVPFATALEAPLNSPRTFDSKQPDRRSPLRLRFERLKAWSAEAAVAPVRFSYSPRICVTTCQMLFESICRNSLWRHRTPLQSGSVANLPKDSALILRVPVSFATELNHLYETRGVMRQHHMSEQCGYTAFEDNDPKTSQEARLFDRRTDESFPRGGK